MCKPKKGYVINHTMFIFIFLIRNAMGQKIKKKKVQANECYNDTQRPHVKNLIT